MDHEFATRSPDFAPTHPGELMKEDILPTLDLSVAMAAERMHISRSQLNRVLTAKSAVTAEMAIRFAKLCGNTPRLWLNMQAAYDIWHAERRVDFSDIKVAEIVA